MVLAALLGGAWLLVRANLAAGHGGWTSGKDKPRVLVTIYPLYLFAAHIAGSDAEVRCLLPPGADPHEFAVSPVHVRLADGADVIISNGAGIDDFVVDAIDRASASARLSTVAHELDLLAHAADPTGAHHHGDGHDHGGLDPHAWLDPVLARKYAQVAARSIADELDRRTDALAADRVRERTALLDTQLDALHRDYERRLAPHRGKPVLAFHGSMAYLTRRYGLRLAAVWQETPGKEPAPRDVARLLNVAKAQGIGALVAEPQFSRRALDVIATDATLKVVTFDTLEAAIEGGTEGYLDAMQANLDALVTALEATRKPSLTAPWSPGTMGWVGAYSLVASDHEPAWPQTFPQMAPIPGALTAPRPRSAGPAHAIASRCLSTRSTGSHLLRSLHLRGPSRSTCGPDGDARGTQARHHRCPSRAGNCVAQGPAAHTGTMASGTRRRGARGG